MSLRVAVVIPALDEERTIGAVVAEVRLHVDGSVIVVDNGSRDATAGAAAGAGASVVTEPIAGYGRACMAGVAAAPADTDVLVFMDGDGSDRPADIAALLAAIAGGADLALGVRRGDAVERGSIALAARIGNLLAGVLIGALWGSRLHDLSPLKAVRAPALRALAPRERGYGWTVELLASAVRAGLRVEEVEVGYRRRAGGSSKVSGQLRASLRAGTRILATLARVAHAGWGPRVDGAIAGGAVAAAALGTFGAWLVTSPAATPSALVAVWLAAWPVLLTGAALGWGAVAIVGRWRGGARP